MERQSWTWHGLAEIGGLAAIVVLLFVTFTRRPGDREARALSTCVSNVNRLNKAALMYAVDYGLRYPRPYFDGDGDGHYAAHHGPTIAPGLDYAWPAVLRDYDPTLADYTCPLFGRKTAWDGRVAPVADRYGVGYGYNSRLSDVGFKATRLSYPAQTVLFFDLTRGMVQPWAALPDDGNDDRPGSLSNVEERVRANHFGKAVRWLERGDADTGFAVVGYADGHAKAVKMEFLLVRGAGAEGNRWAPKR